MPTSLYRLLFGYVRVNATGFNLERFINLVTRRNIVLWNIKRKDGSISFNVRAKDFKKLIGFSKKASVKLKITGKYGQPFFLKRYRKRYVLIGGIIVFLLLMCYMTSFIWLIEIDGNSRLSDYEIMNALNANGLKTGAFKGKLNTTDIERNVKNNVDGIEWISININGTKATVNIKESLDVITTHDTVTPCDIISDKNALISDIMVNTGKPMVKVGDVVRKGDVLISADITYQQDGVDIIYGSVYSSGSIKGKVVRKISKTIPYTLNLKRYTQNSLSSYNIKIFNTNFNTNFTKSAVYFENYDIIREIKQLSIGERFPLPIIITKLVYREYNAEKIKLSHSDASLLAKKALDNEIMYQYSVNCDIINKDCSFVENKNTITATATVTAIEPIGIESYIVPGAEYGGNTVNGTTENTN